MTQSKTASALLKTQHLRLKVPAKVLTRSLNWQHKQVSVGV